LPEGVGDLLRAVEVEPWPKALERQHSIGRREVSLEPLGRLVSPLAHYFFELLPPRDIELDAGELHLRYGRDGRELYLRDRLEPLRLERFFEPFAQRQEDRGVAGCVLELPAAELARPVLTAGRLVHRLVQVPLRHRLQGVGRAVFAAVQELRGEHRVEEW
jgi:GNAT superfamily N-acetyltransferase